MDIQLPARVTDRYEMYNYGNAWEILYSVHPQEFNELIYCLENLEFGFSDILKSGGNKSPMPKKLDDILFPLGWKEVKITADLVVRRGERGNRSGSRGFTPDWEETITIPGYIDGHNVDFVKGSVALDMEWNSKDQTFDRDLLAMRAYYDARIIDVGIIITRAPDISEIIYELQARYPLRDIKGKYGASTTWMGKLLPRLDARRNGGCPILAIGIKKECFIDDDY